MMRNSFFLLLATLLCISCGDSNNSLLTPPSSGLPYEMLVVCDKDTWEAPAGRALFDVLDSDVPAIPQSERSFRISFTEPAGFTRLLKSFRNIIEVKIDKTQFTQTKFKYTEDKYAAPQMILTIQSPSREDFLDYVTKNSQVIIDFFTSAEMNRELRDLRKEKNHNISFLDSIKKKFGCEMFISKNIRGIKSGKDFLWASDISNNNSSIQNYVVYSYPYTSVDNFSRENFLQKRDSVMKVNIPGNRPDRYMATDTMFVDVYDTEFRQRYMQVAKGLWQMENDMMGGPFVSHQVVDEKNGRVIVAETFLYAPNKKKGDLIRKLEAALFSLKLPADKDIENSTIIPEVIIEDNGEEEETAK
ncbi:MAG: DUF4837 family protein [Bacteroidales bacterium]|nr:DUF4837 family protein [Bacteroidales bacterium]